MSAVDVTPELLAQHMGTLTEEEREQFMTKAKMKAGALGIASENKPKRPLDPQQLAIDTERRRRIARDTVDRERSEGSGYTLELISFDTVTPKRTDWLWNGRIPRGMLAEMIGTEGLGKSAESLDLVSDVTRGTLDGDFVGTPANVVLLTTEDDPERTIWPRLDAAGADKSRVKFVKLSKDGKDAGLVLPRDAELLGRSLREADVRLLVIDPLAGVLDPSVDTYKDTDVREALAPLVAAAHAHDFAVLGIRHTNKGKSTNARERAIGSVGFRQIVRSALVVTLDPDDEEGKAGSGRMVCHDKCNVGPLMKSVKFRLDGVPVVIDGKTETYVKATRGEECDWLASDGLAAEAGIPEEQVGGKTGRALAILRETAFREPTAVGVLKERAESEGIGWRTMEAARGTLGLESWKPKGTNANVWGYRGLSL